MQCKSEQRVKWHGEPKKETASQRQTKLRVHPVRALARPTLRFCRLFYYSTTVVKRAASIVTSRWTPFPTRRRLPKKLRPVFLRGFFVGRQGWWVGGGELLLFIWLFFVVFLLFLFCCSRIDLPGVLLLFFVNLTF